MKRLEITTRQTKERCKTGVVSNRFGRICGVVVDGDGRDVVDGERVLLGGGRNGGME